MSQVTQIIRTGARYQVPRLDNVIVTAERSAGPGCHYVNTGKEIFALSDEWLAPAPPRYWPIDTVLRNQHGLIMQRVDADHWRVAGSAGPMTDVEVDQMPGLVEMVPRQTRHQNGPETVVAPAVRTGRPAPAPAAMTS